MKSLYLECASGISGDMAVAALLDAGADEAALRKALDSIPVRGFTVEISRVKKAGIDCADFNVILDEAHENHDHDMDYLFGHETNGGYSEHHHGHGGADGHEHHHEEEPHAHNGGHHHAEHEHRGMAEITQIINGTDMTDGARSLALKIFNILAEAESKAHGIPAEQVHFHEVGALDSIVDVVALAVCFDSLNVSRVYVPSLFEGGGTVRCQHGILPVPVPAVAQIAGQYALPLSLSGEPGEFITPTGAAFVAAVRTDGELPRTVRIVRTGLGAGKRAYRRPSILRAIIIEETESAAESGALSDTVIKLETNIDDCTGETLGFLLAQLMEAGALDVQYIPCFMKKNRPAYILCVLCKAEKTAELERLIFLNTTTIGIRRCTMERTVLARETRTVETPLGTARVKVADVYGTKRISPEYESVKSLCKESGCSFGDVYRAVEEAGQHG
ncbi:MAG: nickel pincer cofactor biosynthesis protein LarC [Treponema sp.]|nr:nickel pincer cofactor biosynthesis protein LarC [Treponema sp.]